MAQTLLSTVKIENPGDGIHLYLYHQITIQNNSLQMSSLIRNIERFNHFLITQEIIKKKNFLKLLKLLSFQERKMIDQ